jgi:hypothetical protein
MNSMIYFFSPLIMLFALIFNPGTQDVKKSSVCDVQFTKQKPVLDALWDKKFWEGSEVQTLKNHMGSMPSHFPDTQVKLKYDNNNIYVIFRVKDHYTRAVAKVTNGRICEDSCVELFFTPGADVSRGYFNLETNCKGVFLFEYHLKNRTKQGFVDLKDAGEIEMSHSLEKNVENEITEPLTWTVEYKIPLSILSKYMDVDKPASGVRWRANFYKCGDKTSHPHWLTWAPVEYPTPNFHLPEFFGWLEFK